MALNIVSMYNNNNNESNTMNNNNNKFKRTVGKKKV